MKIKAFIVFCLALLFVSCSDDSNSKELAIEKIKITELGRPSQTLDDLLSVVPGSYKLKWRENSSNLRTLYISVDLELKNPIQLASDLNISEKAYDIQLIAVDNNGNDVLPLGQPLYLSKESTIGRKMVDEDEAQRFYEFLSSEAGAEASFTFSNGMWSNENLCSSDDAISSITNVRLQISIP